MVRQSLVAGLLIVGFTSLITGCMGKGVSPFPITLTPPAETAPQFNTSPIPHPTAFPGPTEEGKPTPPGGEQPFATPPAATLPPENTAWREYELADIGLRIRIPAEWEKLNMPGGYIFAASGQYRISVTSCCEEMPRRLPEFQQALTSHLHNQYEEEFTIVPMKGKQWEGVQVWHKSNPDVCLTVYIPTPEMVRQITFFDPVFCEPDGEHLVPLGEMILGSVETLSPK
ncbi:MAG: hypothetical protein H5T61_08795 [Thermoflexales bacterium]|nr:hypothetical protein [Thermoflexales bacterium]